MELLTQAKTAEAGIGLMMEIIGQIHTRRPDLIAQACEQVLGLKATVGDDVFNAAMQKRVDAVTTFDPIAKRIAELETTLAAVRELAKRPSHHASGKRPDIQVRCTEVLKS